jgi:hypothetical protein
VKDHALNAKSGRAPGLFPLVLVSGIADARFVIMSHQFDPRPAANPLFLEPHREPARRGRIEVGIHAREEKQVILKILDGQSESGFAGTAREDAHGGFFENEFRRTQRTTVPVGNCI